MTAGVAVTAEEARKRAAEEKLREAMKEFFGNEKTIIVENTTKGGVSIGFGKIGQDAGQIGWLIPRSRLPIILTDQFPSEYWRDSPDFRQALSKGWIKFVTPEEYERAVESERAHEARLAALAGNEQPKVVAYDAQINPLNAQTINSQTAQLQAATPQDLASQVAAYEAKLATPPPAPVLKDGRSARAEALVEKTRRGAVSSMDSLKELDQDNPLYTDEDLAYIAQNAEYPSLKSFAQSLLNTRKVS